MPKRTDIKSICIIGAGPIIIGQACEFDYSGVQACKALKEEGYRVILVNSNPATIMTDPGLADATYIEPITPAVVAKILEKERPDALLPTMGGQTALNTALSLFHNGTLERLGIEMIGAKADVIEKAEDRLKFRDAMDKIGLESPRSRVVKNFDEALDALAFVGLPAIIRPSFTLAGTGGGIAFNRAEFEDIVRGGLRASPVNEVLIEESVLGWKEYEMEVVRDSKDNCIIICSIENIDAMGVHTGDSMTVAPALTLTDKEYQIMRNASLTVLREIGVDTGGSNVQFGIHPDTGRMVVIEMNPRVSRSSALASKATGFPIAKIAAKLAVGYTLDELDNDITGSTPASFEPTIDYVVTKIPRFAFEKFPGADNTLTTSMKSVGEVMAIGRTFAESMQKALRGLETGLTGFDEIDLRDANGNVDQGRLRHMLSRPTPERLLIVAQAMRHGWTVEQIYEECKYDPWFMRQIEAIVQEEAAIKEAGLSGIDAQYMNRIKAMGFSDARLATLLDQPEAAVAAHRRALNVRPVFKRIDTCAAEFASDTPYMYSTYEGNGLEPAECEAEPTDKKKVVILGGGPNRIGQGIEFDYCCVHAVYALQEAGYETIMVNCNPETVSTDYDTADRLYFEPLTAEDVIELVEKEKQNGEVVGLIVQFGGQTPLKLAKALEQAGLPILGTTPDAIDLAEDRERFQQLLHKLELRQPANGLARSLEEAVAVAEKIGFPVVIRPSYVLGGRAMEIVHDMAGLHRYIATAVKVSGNNPVLIDSYLQNAIEVDVDAVADADGEVYVAGIMEHIEEAGIHSGDSACALPPYTLSKPVIDELTVQAVKLAKGLNVVGLMNIQFAVKQTTDGPGIGGYDIYILEVNPRASRTVPFVAKATGTAIAKIAARVMAGEKLSQFKLSGPFPPHTAVKEAVFPFNRFPGVDILLGPEMRSTGEVMGLDKNFGLAFAKSQMGAGVTLPKEGTVFISVRDGDKGAMVPVAAKLLEMGFKVIATRGTAKHLADNGVKVGAINKVVEGQPHIVDAMINGNVQLIFNTTEGSQAVSDSFSLRRAALTNNIPYYTTVAGAEAAVEAISALKVGGLDVAPLQSYLSGSY
ncbi:carbamoyl-phosphate synthase large subunit [Niveispirillum sp.]|uniref:carbamoyl-phosphate synthase large subunit n=1 Tax=Niveispirillum sp. TaxID=1917217 RepID=UPI001B5F6C2C|nr:carbamoyl-phosphate synthase large subunit [Niveispirillum sp.]MBP7335849.1 carbamoyl-phosphate synthase large subunit [Niveispirillum sp.]